MSEGILFIAAPPEGMPESTGACHLGEWGLVPDCEDKRLQQAAESNPDMLLY